MLADAMITSREQQLRSRLGHKTKEHARLKLLIGEMLLICNEHPEEETSKKIWEYVHENWKDLGLK